MSVSYDSCFPVNKKKDVFHKRFIIIAKSGCYHYRLGHGTLKRNRNFCQVLNGITSERFEAMDTTGLVVVVAGQVSVDEIEKAFRCLMANQKANS